MNILRRSLTAPARRTLLNATRAASSSSSSSGGKPTFGVVFDVDGVLLRGRTPIPGAKEVLQDLRENDIPFAIMTNGGGYPEAKKAKQISQIIGVDLSEELLCMSHTPMRTLVDKHGDDLVLAVGKDCDEISALMANYGFKNVVTVGQLHSHYPTMYPDIKVVGDVPLAGRFDTQPFGAVFVLIDPIYWGRELQIVMDVLCSQEGHLGKHGGKQHVRWLGE